MADLIIANKSDLVSVADAIRTKTGGTEKLSFPTGFVSAVNGISGSDSGTVPVAQPAIMEGMLTWGKFFEEEVDIVAGSELQELTTGELLYYNHEQLPEIPAEVLENYKYILIMRSLSFTRIYASNGIFYYHVKEDGTKRIDGTVGSGGVRYTLNTDANAWVPDSVSSSYYAFNINGDGNWSVWWSNFDIPSGSADATDIYWYASEPEAEEPEAATRYFYNGVLLPKIPDDVLSAYPYLVIARSNADVIRIYGSTSTIYYYIPDDEKIYIPASRMRVTLDTEANTWGEVETATNGTNLNLTETWELLWAGQDIPNGSATATSIYLYGTHAVPDSV